MNFEMKIHTLIFLANHLYFWCIGYAISRSNMGRHYIFIGQLNVWKPTVEAHSVQYLRKRNSWPSEGKLRLILWKLKRHYFIIIITSRYFHLGTFHIIVSSWVERKNIKKMLRFFSWEFYICTYVSNRLLFVLYYIA